MAVMITSAVLIELAGLPVDIFNIVMVISKNSIEIAQGLNAAILNWVLVVINYTIIAIASSVLAFLVIA